MELFFSGAVVTVPSQCEETASRMRVGGPFWSAPIHSQEIVDELLNRLVSSNENGSLLPYPVPTISRLTGLLITISEEIKDVPLHYTLPDLAACLHIPSPNLIDIQAALVNAGYRVSQAHHEPTAIKTDAPNKYYIILYLSYGYNI
jgi:tRNA (guanine26-N2/guanine27-N2)-dimethyltransferase